MRARGLKMLTSKGVHLRLPSKHREEDQREMIREQPFSGESGFTLVELMVVVTLAAIVLVVGIPTFRDVIDRTSLATATNMLIGSMNAARSEAVTRQVPVVICASSDGGTCSGNDDWSTGWIIFSDPDTNDPPAVGLDSELLRVVGSPGTRVVLGGTHAYVRYYANGSAEAL
jgi:type IV fimbrial biogenesis protein FimT